MSTREKIRLIARAPLDGESANSLCEMIKNEYFLCNFLSFFLENCL